MTDLTFAPAATAPAPAAPAATASAAAPITAAELYDRLLRDDRFVVLDVRNPAEFARMRVEGRRHLEVMNVPYYAFVEDEDEAAAQVPTDRPVVVVCAKEGSSEYVAELLAARGFDVRYLAGGFPAWGNHYDVRDIAHGDWGRVVQVARPARGDLSFVVISDGQAAVIDPLRHVDVYHDILAAADASLRVVLDTHVHADHISGGPALAAATGAPYHVHAYDAIHPIDMLPATIPYASLDDGQTFDVGATTITARWFPGHTLGQFNFRLDAPDGSSALFTGDGIFLRSFGRPDLGGQGEAWTPLLYRSLTERLPAMVDPTTRILPAHFSALDEAGPDGAFSAPFATVAATNDALRPRDEAEFTAYVLGHLPVFPPEYVVIKRVNIGLVPAGEELANELELGKNICALGS